MNEVSPENRAMLEKRYRAAALIVAAQIVFTLILTAALWFFTPPTVNTVSQQTLMTLWVSMIFLAVGAFVLRRVFFRWDRLKDVTLLKGISGLLKNLQVNAIILGVFATLLPIIGGVIAFLSGATFEIIRAEIVALIVFLINFPRKSVWEKITAGMEKI